VRLAVLLLVAWPVSALAQSPARIAAYRAALSEAPADAALHAGLADARGEVACPPGLAPPSLGGVRHAVSPLDLLALSVASALAATAGAVGRKLGRSRSGGAAVVAGLVGWAATLALAVIVEVERRDERSRPPVVVATPATLRGGNGPNFPPRWPTPLPPGVEGVALYRRGGWVQVVLNDGSPGGLVGWLPEGAVIGVADATRMTP